MDRLLWRNATDDLSSSVRHAARRSAFRVSRSFSFSKSSWKSTGLRVEYEELRESASEGRPARRRKASLPLPAPKRPSGLSQLQCTYPRRSANTLRLQAVHANFSSAVPLYGSGKGQLAKRPSQLADLTGWDGSPHEALGIMTDVLTASGWARSELSLPQLFVRGDATEQEASEMVAAAGTSMNYAPKHKNLKHKKPLGYDTGPSSSLFSIPCSPRPHPSSIQRPLLPVSP